MNVNTCRLCCEKEGTTFIFGSKNELLISSIISYCCGNLKISEGDGLPDHICGTCELDLASSYSFVLKCENSDKKLRRQILCCPLQVLHTGKEFIPKLEVKYEEKSVSDNVDDGDHMYAELCDDDNIPLYDLKQNQLDIKMENNELPLLRPKRVYRKRIKYKEKLKCCICNKECARRSSLDIHMRSHTNDKPYTCSLCDKKFKDSGNLKMHMVRNHHEKRQRDFICEHCGKGFFTKSDVKIHMRVHTGETPYSCTVCPMRFTQVGALLRHKKRHTGERAHACPTCNKKFCTKDEVKNHEKAHTTEKKFLCSICNVLFKYKNSLKKHLKVHMEPNSFVCNYCGRTFHVKGNLKSHIKSQHSEKSGFCNTCSKSVSNIESHMWKHMGQRPLKCQMCSSTFYDMRGLGHHVAFRHKNVNKFKCTFEGCDLSFPSRPMLDFHTAKLHGTIIPFQCDRCPRGFYRKNDLARHKIGTHKERLQ